MGRLIFPERGGALLLLARGAIAGVLGEPSAFLEPAPWQREPGATFVSLRLEGELRGCVGTLRPRGALRADVESNARGAAFRDPRFAPLSRAEYRRSEVEVSLLSPLEELDARDPARLLGLLRPGVDGLVLECGDRRATFLPQVWERLPDPEAFLAHLKLKVGLPRDYWSPELRAARYTVSAWREGQP